MELRRRTFDIALFVGCFLSGIFILLGGIGCAVWGSELIDFVSNGSRWTRATGTVLSASLDTSPGRRSGTVYRPVIEVQLDDGSTVKGFDLTNIWSTRSPWMDEAIARYPVGSKVEVMLSPHDPHRMALERGELGNALLLGIPAVFLGLGLVGMALTLFRGVWIARGRPSNGLWRFAPGSQLLDYSVQHGLRFWVALFVAVYFGVISLLFYMGWEKGNFLLILVGLFFIYGFWKAVFPFFKQQKRGKASRRR